MAPAIDSIDPSALTIDIAGWKATSNRLNTTPELSLI